MLLQGAQIAFHLVRRHVLVTRLDIANQALTGGHDLQHMAMKLESDPGAFLHGAIFGAMESVIHIGFAFGDILVKVGSSSRGTC